MNIVNRSVSVRVAYRAVGTPALEDKTGVLRSSMLFNRRWTSRASKKKKNLVYPHISISPASEPSGDGVRIIFFVAFEVRVCRFDIRVLSYGKRGKKANRRKVVYFETS